VERLANELEFYTRQQETAALRVARQPGLGRIRGLLRGFELNRFAAAATLLETGRIFVDLGTNLGGMLAYTSGQYEIAIGVDLVRPVLADAQRNYTNANFVQADVGMSLPLRDGAVDCLVAMGILEHVFDVYGFVTECRRVIRSAGIVILEVPNVAYVTRRIGLLIGKLPVTSSPYGWREGFGWDGGHLHYFTERALCQLLEEGGFRVVRVMASNGLFGAYRNWWVSLLAGNLLVKAVRL
jgi:SAM-dependent methyltransferase